MGPSSDMQEQIVTGRDDRILVAGISRSGSSWLIEALGVTPGTKRWYEPDNIDADPTGTKPVGRSGFGPYPIIHPGDDGGVFKSLWDVAFGSTVHLDRFGGLLIPILRPMLKLPQPILHRLVRVGSKVLTTLPGKTDRIAVKSVYTCFCLDWLVEEYDPKVIIIQRNPLNVISSWRELKIPAFDLMTRPELIRLYADRYEGPPPTLEDSPLTRMAWQVGLTTTAMGDSLDRHPGWVVANHEDLCVEPAKKFKALFEKVGVPWSEDVEAYLEKSNRPGEGLKPVRVTSEQVDRWKSRLTASEVEEINSVLARFPRKGWIREPSS
ncbi:MAG: hypothetical protein HKL82_12825 [Acidimicrobiaceae bacterium]|nr:hypothetical protein [Acidimicrobiaceae bacterium]